MAQGAELPIACTLTGGSLAERAEWLRRLGSEALIEGVRRGDRLELMFKTQAADDVRELVRAERECCPFLDFEVEQASEHVALTVTGPPEAVPVLEDMLTVLRAV